MSSLTSDSRTVGFDGIHAIRLQRHFDLPFGQPPVYGDHRWRSIVFCFSPLTCIGSPNKSMKPRPAVTS